MNPNPNPNSYLLSSSNKRPSTYDNSIFEPRRETRNANISAMLRNALTTAIDNIAPVSDTINLPEYHSPTIPQQPRPPLQRASWIQRNNLISLSTPRTPTPPVMESRLYDSPIMDFTYDSQAQVFSPSVFFDSSQSSTPSSNNNNNNNNNNNMMMIQETVIQEETAPTLEGGSLKYFFSFHENDIVYRVTASDLYPSVLQNAIATPLDTLKANPESIPASQFSSNVIAYFLNNCLDITNMKHEFNGKLHCYLRNPGMFLVLHSFFIITVFLSY